MTWTSKLVGLPNGATDLASGYILGTFDLTNDAPAGIAAVVTVTKRTVDIRVVTGSDYKRIVESLETRLKETGPSSQGS
jgi:hypothetical protein